VSGLPLTLFRIIDCAICPSNLGFPSPFHIVDLTAPGPSLSPVSDRPTHARTMSLDVDTLMATMHPKGPEDGIGAYAKYAHRTASLDLPSLMSSVAAEAQAEAPQSPISPLPKPHPVEVVPVEFGEPKTIRKASTGSTESQTGSGTMRRSSIAKLISSSGENASNTGSLALRAMRSVRSIARLGGWGKGEESGKEKEEGTVKDKKKKRKKLPVFESEPTTSGESWEAGELGRDPTITITAPLGQPIQPNMQIKRSRAGLDARGNDEKGNEAEDEDWVAGDRRSSGSSRVVPSTMSLGKNPRPRTSHESSGSSEYAPSSAYESSFGSSAHADPAELGEPHHSPGMGYDSLFSVSSSQVGVDINSIQDSIYCTERGQDPSRGAREDLTALFNIPPREASPPHVEVRGVKIDKGRVRDRVREFEARAEEHVFSAAYPSTGSIRFTSLSRHGGSALPSGPVNARRDSYMEERQYALSVGRCVSVPLLNESPACTTQPRPKSEQQLWSRPQSMMTDDGMSLNALRNPHILTIR
jgi:hypothetical protein